MEKVTILKVEKTLCQYNGVPAIRIRAVNNKGDIYEQTYNKGSQSYQKLLQKSSCNDLKSLQGKEVEAIVEVKNNKSGKAWKYLYFY